MARYVRAEEKSPPLTPTPPSRVLIVRLSAIGDAVLTLPLLCALRRWLPRAHLAWAAHPAAAEVLRGHPDLDELIVVPKRVYAQPRTLATLALQLRARQFDITLDPQSLSKSALLSWFSEAPRRLGFGGRGHEIAPWLQTELVHPRTRHLTDRTLELLKPLGASPHPVEFRLPHDTEAEARMQAALARLELQRGRFALINPGATWPSKRWPPQRFGEVAAELATRHHTGLATLVLWGSPEEHAWALEVERASNGVARVAPPTTLRDLVALCRMARLMVSADSGPLHIAVAAQTPCVGLYGPTRPADCGPYGPPHIALQARYQAGSRRERRRATNDAMREITVADVCNASEQLLNRTVD